LKSHKLADHEAEIAKINSTFIAILRDIKKDMEDGKTPGTPVTAEFLQVMREQIHAARQEQKSIGAEDIVAVIMNMVGQTLPMDEKSSEMFRQLAQGLLTKQEEMM
jgi:hypothetical protein